MKSFLNPFKTFLTKLFNNILKRIRRLDIFKRLIIFSLIIILIPDFMIGYFSFDKFSKEIDSTISKFSRRALKNLDTNITERLKRYSDLSYKIYLNNELKDLLRKCGSFKAMKSMTSSQLETYDKYKKRIGNILYEMSSSLPDIANMEIVSYYDEFTQINNNGEKTGARISDLDAFRNSPYYKRAIEVTNLPVWWDTSKETSTYISQHIPSAHIGNYVTTFRSIPEPGTEKPLGIIVINISLNSLFNMLINNEALAQRGNLVLLGDSGIIQYFNPQPVFVRLDYAVIKEILNLNTDTIITKISGKEYLIFAIKSDYTGWTLSGIIPRSSLLQSVYDIRNLIIFICMICIIFALIMSYIVTVSISRPIKNLKNTMGEVDEKNIEIVYNDNVSDEVGILGQKFNSMIKRIQNLINTVYEAELTKKEEIIRRKEAELDALQMQINPHFLYNTLDIIRWQVMSQENGEGKASKMIAGFSELLRLGTKKSFGLVTIREELDHINAYINVVQFDLEFDLNVEFIIEDEIINSCRIPKLTMQPLIENAIIHGFSHDISDGRIVIKAYVRDDDIFIEIQDNGKGIPEDVIVTINNDINQKDSKSGNIGLRNVNERIKLNFGEGYGIKLESKLGEYTAVLVHIPVTK